MEPSTSKTNENDLNYNSDSSCSSDGTSEKCPICLLSLRDQEIGKPSTCEHLFCYICISDWAKVVRTCPIDRSEFKEITILKSFEDRSLLRLETLDKKCVGLDEFLEDDEVTYCEVCRQSDREDQMLLCDGCDLGFHMSCLPNPLTEIPHGNWYCDNCFSSESEDDESTIAHEINLLNADIEDNGGLTVTRLRFAHQRSPISRTRQSQRIVSAIRRIRDSNSEGETATPTPSTSRSVTTTRKRRSRKRTTRRRYRTVITEYDVDGDDKFAMKTRKIRRKIRRRRRKQAKTSRSERKSRSNNNNLSMLKNTNTFQLQQSRAAAGITNFSIFEPANQLDYVSDENMETDLYPEYSTGRGEGCLIAPAGAINRNRSLKKSMLIKQRVLENIPTTSSVNILDSIMQQQEMWLDKNAFRKNFTVETSGKVKCLASSKDKAPCDGGDQNHSQNQNSNQVNFGTNSTQTKATESQSMDVGSQNAGSSESSGNSGSNKNNDEIYGPQQGHFISSFAPAVDKKEKSDEKDKNKNDCPNFSIYSAESLNFLSKDQGTSNVDVAGPSEEHELYDLVQESDGDDAVGTGTQKSEIYNPDSPTGNDDEIYNPESPTNFDTDSTPKTTSNSNFQIAKTPEPTEMPTFKGMQVKGFKKPQLDFDMFEDSDDIESKKETVEKTEPVDSGSYTPPIKQPDSAKKSNPDEKSKRQQKDNKNDKRNIEIYDIRKRIGNRDEFGRNKSRSRSMSKERRSRSRSRSSNRSRSASKRRFLRKRSRKRSGTGSPAEDRKKRLRRERSESKSRRNKNKRRRSRSRSRTPPPRRHRSRSFSISPSPKPVRSPTWSRSRSRSNTRHKNSRRDPPKYRHRSKSPKKSKSRDNKVKKRKTHRKSRTRTPPLPASMQKPRNVSPSPPKKASRDSDQKNQKKSKKKKSESSKSKGLRSAVAVPSTLSKEVFTSGENILVSVNFNNNKTNKVSPHSRRSNSKEKDRIKLLEAPKEVVDITTKKKLDSVKPVAIIDLDRSPFKELTPEYNVIELSDSENEKQIKSPDPPKSPAAKLYDPYDILNSPAENVTSSVENFGADVTTTAQTTIQQNHMLAKEKDDKVTDQSMINVYNTTITAIPCISASSGEDNVDMIVSSTNPNCKVDAVDDKNQNNSQLSPYADLNTSALDSPYSPASDGYDDLFAASSYHTDSPKKSAKAAKMGKMSGNAKNADKFDALFGSTSPVPAPVKKHRKKVESGDQPNKLLLKLNRQERAIEESKVALKPYYSKRVIDKNEYKDILRKAVPKICHSKSGEINPKKIKDLIDAYVKKVKYRKKHGLSSSF